MKTQSPSQDVAAAASTPGTPKSLGFVRWRNNVETASLNSDAKSVTSADGTIYRTWMMWLLKTQDPQLEGSSFQLRNGLIPTPPKTKRDVRPVAVINLTKRLAASRDANAWICVVCHRRSASTEEKCRVCGTRKDYKFRANIGRTGNNGGRPDKVATTPSPELVASQNSAPGLPPPTVGIPNKNAKPPIPPQLSTSESFRELCPPSC